MQTKLAPEFENTHDGRVAEDILRKCVHCGFCTATCPTYQLLGDELDGPRGRIYLMKQVLEGVAPTRSTQLHLDRCLTCRNCESTCPSGVEYGQLLEIGRKLVDERVERPLPERMLRGALAKGLTSPLFAPAIALGRAVRPLLPAALKAKVPTASTSAGAWPQREHTRKVLLLAGCVQPALMPNINNATARVLDKAGIQTVVAGKAGCCGAIRSHLSDPEGGLDDMRRNVDAWWPLVQAGAVEAIVTNASGCGVMVKDYGHALARDAGYAERARRIGELAKDIGELLPGMAPQLAPLMKRGATKPRLAYHPSCTLQHGQQLRHSIEASLRELGFQVELSRTESHLCCGSAGTYSVLNPTIAHQLRDRKLAQLSPLAPDAIVSNNIGCIQHLQSGTQTAVRHWIEVLDEALASN